MKVFIDNDIILKISSIAAWKEVEETFRVKRDSFYVLPTAKNYIQKSKTVKKNYTEEVIKYALEFIATCNEITEQQINKDDKFRDYKEWDSLAVLSLIAMIKQNYNITIPRKDFDELNTVSELFEYIQAHR